MGLIVGGFIPTQLHQVVDYVPTALELLVTMGIYTIGAFILTILFKMVVGVRNRHKLYRQNPADRGTSGFRTSI